MIQKLWGIITDVSKNNTNIESSKILMMTIKRCFKKIERKLALTKERVPIMPVLTGMMDWINLKVREMCVADSVWWKINTIEELAKLRRTN